LRVITLKIEGIAAVLVVGIDKFGSPLFVDIITKTNADKLKKHLTHKE